MEGTARRALRRRAPRILVDLGLALVLTLVMAIIEDVAHEWLGIAAFVLVAAHQVLNRAWWRALFRGATPRGAWAGPRSTWRWSAACVMLGSGCIAGTGDFVTIRRKVRQ